MGGLRVVKFHFTHSKLGNQSFLAERFIAKCQMLKSKWDFTTTDDNASTLCTILSDVNLKMKLLRFAYWLT